MSLIKSIFVVGSLIAFTQSSFANINPANDKSIVETVLQKNKTILRTPSSVDEDVQTQKSSKLASSHLPNKEANPMRDPSLKSSTYCPARAAVERNSKNQLANAGSTINSKSTTSTKGQQ